MVTKRSVSKRKCTGLRQLNVRIPAELKEQVDAYCKVNGRHKEVFVAEALRQYLGATCDGQSTNSGTGGD